MRTAWDSKNKKVQVQLQTHIDCSYVDLVERQIRLRGHAPHWQSCRLGSWQRGPLCARSLAYLRVHCCLVPARFSFLPPLIPPTERQVLQSCRRHLELRTQIGGTGCFALEIMFEMEIGITLLRNWAFLYSLSAVYIFLFFQVQAAV